ncbi:MAG: acetate uptake transporter [Solirubrobacteraceae bacterium]
MSANTESGAGSSGGWSPANPGPLGLAAFGITTLFLSIQNANLISANDLGTISAVALAFGGVVQVLAGMWEFRAGNVFGAVAFSSFGGFWISFYIIVNQQVPSILLIKPASAILITVHSSLGAYLWIWGIFTIIMVLCSFTQPRVTTLLFTILAITFVLLGIGNSGASTNMIHAGGYFGIATAAVALYLVAANIMKAEYGRWVLPVFPVK